jgi:hypothetical protein
MSTTRMIRYTTRPESADENERLVRQVFAELADRSPAGLHYATFRLDDGVSFVHIASVEDHSNPLAEVEAFARFQADVRDRCEEQPVVTELHEVGSYRP